MDIVEKITLSGKTLGDHIGELSVATGVVIFTVAALFAFALHYGKDRMVALILAIYVGLLIFVHFPYTDKLLFFKDSESELILSNAVVYMAFVLITYVVIERVVWAEYPEGARKLLEAFLLALTASAALLAFAYNILPVASFYNLDPSIELLFASTKYFFWWLILPLIAIFFFSKR